MQAQEIVTYPAYHTRVDMLPREGMRPSSAGSVAREVLWDAMLVANTEQGYVPDRDRQQIVFDRVSWDTLDSDIAEAKKGSGEGAGKMLRGKLFEMLIQADPVFGERTALEIELLDLAHNPDAFGLGKELGYHRNPDLAFLLVQDDEGVVIEGVGESKLGLLNERSFRQLSESGFAAGVKALVDVVNGLDDPEKHGLVAIAEAKKQLAPGKPLLRMAPDFTQLLVVPANRKIEWKSTLINRKEFSKEGRNAFYAMLEDESKVKTARAAFSTNEVSAMTAAL